MRVGDIVIEDGRVSFGKGSSQASSNPVSPPPAVSPDPISLRHVLAGLPGQPRRLALGAAGLLVIAGVTVSAALATGSSFSAMTLAAMVAVPAISAGLGLLVLATLKHTTDMPRPRSINSSMEDDEELFRRRMVKLQPHLDEGHSTATFEFLLQASGFLEATLLHTLTAAEAKGIVNEELDLESGQYYYRLNRSQISAECEPAAKSLDDRLRDHTETTKES